MPVYRVIKLKNLSPLHLGTGREEYEFAASALHSDTLSAALTAMAVGLGRTNDAAAFIRSFTLSSAFPFCRETYYLPRIKGKLPVGIKGKRAAQCDRLLESVRYIGLEGWSRLAQGEPLTITSDRIREGFLLDAAAEEGEIPYRSQVSRRAGANRVEGEGGGHFFFEWTYFRPDAGLYCLVDTDASHFELLEELFAALGEAGLGTDKSVGGGHFEVEATTLALPDVTDANGTVLLSLYLPARSEMPLLRVEEAAYGLLLRGGYAAGSSEEAFRPLRKQTVYMFSAGSRFPTTNPLVGRVVELTPVEVDGRMHPVYRSGLPLSVPIKSATPWTM
jgi:CRISPR type III-A-associated RAMP protein Csm4